jgi:hypothetical protein
MRLADKIKSWFGRTPEDPADRAAAKKLQDERETIKTSQLGAGRGPMPSTLPPTPDVIDPDR